MSTPTDDTIRVRLPQQQLSPDIASDVTGSRSPSSSYRSTSSPPITVTDRRPSPPSTALASLPVAATTARPRLSFGISQILQQNDTSSSSSSASSTTDRHHQHHPTSPERCFPSAVDDPAGLSALYRRQQQHAAAAGLIFPPVGFAVVSSGAGGGVGSLSMSHHGAQPPSVIRVPTAHRLPVCVQQTTIAPTSAAGGMTAAAVAAAAACRLSAMMFPWMRERKDGMTCELLSFPITVPLTVIQY